MTRLGHKHKIIVSVIPKKCSCGEEILDQDAAEWLVKIGLDRGIDIAFLVVKAQEIRNENISITARAEKAEAKLQELIELIEAAIDVQRDYRDLQRKLTVMGQKKKLPSGKRSVRDETA